MATKIKRKDSWLIQVSVPDGKGGYTRKSSTYRPPPGSTPTQASRGAERHMIEFEDKCRGLFSYNDNMTLDDLHSWYMSDIAPNRLKPQSQDVSAYYYNYYIRPLIGRLKLKHITPIALDSAFSQMRANERPSIFYKLKDIKALPRC
ncbi:MAG: hypothetical protein FWE97_04240 [Dehalococcoidia bacterium]|nr:hypothetical protein [Dehalococcoidia bacterium]